MNSRNDAYTKELEAISGTDVYKALLNIQKRLNLYGSKPRLEIDFFHLDSSVQGQERTYLALVEDMPVGKWGWLFSCLSEGDTRALVEADIDRKTLSVRGKDALVTMLSTQVAEEMKIPLVR